MIKGEPLRVSKESLRNTHQWTDTNNNEQKKGETLVGREEINRNGQYRVESGGESSIDSRLALAPLVCPLLFQPLAQVQR